MSKEMKVRALPMWMRLYTVGPHTYMATFPGFTDSKSTFWRRRVSYSLIMNELLKRTS